MQGGVAAGGFLRLAGRYAKGLYWKYPRLIDSYHGQEVTFSAREPITAVVDECGGDLRRAAKRMDLHISTLYRKMEKLGLPLHKEDAQEP